MPGQTAGVCMPSVVQLAGCTVQMMALNRAHPLSHDLDHLLLIEQLTLMCRLNGTAKDLHPGEA